MSIDRRQYSVVVEPVGDIYSRLVTALARMSHLVGVVIRPELKLSEKGERTLAKLRELAVDESEATEWPGTRLLRGKATIVRLPATAEVVEVLREASRGLYSWSHPNLPEDLFFLGEDGSVLLGSIAHEKDAFMTLSDGEESVLLDAVPELSTMIRLA